VKLPDEHQQRRRTLNLLLRGWTDFGAQRYGTPESDELETLTRY
jgi:hypothetical protein